MRIQVYKCRVTGKIFEEKDKAKYITHLKVIRELHKEQRLHEKIKLEFKEWLKKERSEIAEPSDISRWFIENQKYIMDATNALKFGNRQKYYGGFYPTDRFDNIILDVNYTPSVSNMHVCPDDGVTNRGNSDHTKPTDYPGWYGKISGRLLRLAKHDSSYPYSEALNLVGLKTGSGGGGNSSWGYGVSIFLSDWSGLGQILTLNKLKGIS